MPFNYYQRLNKDWPGLFPGLTLSLQKDLLTFSIFWVARFIGLCWNHTEGKKNSLLARLYQHTVEKLAGPCNEVETKKKKKKKRNFVAIYAMMHSITYGTVTVYLLADQISTWRAPVGLKVKEWALQLTCNSWCQSTNFIAPGCILLCMHPKQTTSNNTRGQFFNG